MEEMMKKIVTVLLVTHEQARKWCARGSRALRTALFLTLTFGFVGAAQAASGGGDYMEPVYNTAGEPTSGIAYWTTNRIDDIDYEIRHNVESSDAAVTWGETSATNWYVLSSWQPLTINGGVTCKGDVRLILCGTSTLMISGGIITDSNGSFTIYGDPDGVAELVVTGGGSAAGIGGDDGSDAKSITINGGVVMATGGDCGAGIGGGVCGKGENITINGGVVTATGGEYAAGIGGGFCGNGKNITINGGTLKATGGDSANGIGSGDGESGSNIIVADNLEVKADESTDPPITVIAHTYTTDLAEDLQDKRYVTVKPAVPVAKNVDTDTKYTTVQAAFDEATDGQTVQLLTDVTENVMITVGQANTLDLAGHVLKGADIGTSPVVTINSADAAITICDTSTGHTGAITTGGATYEVNGAGINIAAGSLSLYDVTITNLRVERKRRRDLWWKNTQVLAKNCLIRGNRAGGSGGGIYMVGDTGSTGNPPPETTDKLVLISTLITENEAGTAGAGVYFKRTAKGELSCFVAGTRVAMADGTTKAIEDVREGDVVKTFDHEGGTNSSARVFIWLKEAVTTRAFTLAFAGGYSVDCVLTHDFLMKDGDNSCKYVCLGRANAADYVGKLFYGVDGAWHELKSVIDGEEVSEIYELYTARHFNSYANGMLTVPADVEANLNIYKLDANLKADADQLAADVVKYGYYNYEEVAARGVSRAYYDDSGIKYVNVIVGKGLATWEELEEVFASAQTVAAVGGATALPATTGRYNGNQLFF